MMNLEAIVVDEISMAQSPFYALLTNVKIAWPHLNLIIVGDFRQLPPLHEARVDGMRTTKAFGGNTIRIEQGEWQLVAQPDDRDYYWNSATGEVQWELPSEEALPVATGTWSETFEASPALYFLVDGKGKETHFVQADAKFKGTQNVRLCAGYPLVCWRTNVALGIDNSELFTVDTLEGHTFTVRRDLKTAQRDALDAEAVAALEAERITLRYEDAGRRRGQIGLHRVLWPAFCTTIHASQGDL